MLHRHLNHEDLTLAAIDDVIARGGREDWESLGDAVCADPQLLEKVRRVCQPKLSDPYAQRYHFWSHYADARRAT